MDYIVISVVICLFMVGLNISRLNTLGYTTILNLGVLGAVCGFFDIQFSPLKNVYGRYRQPVPGLFLGTMGIDNCWNILCLPFRAPAIINFVIVLLVFLIPLTDTITVVFNRLSAGKSPFIGGKDHTTHHLFFKGVTEKRIAILYSFLSIVSIGLAYNLIFSFSFILLYVSVFYILLVFVTLYLNTRIKKELTTLKNAILKLKKLNPVILVVIFFAAFSFIYFLLKKSVYPPTTNKLAYVNNNFNILGLNIPANLSFCGEKIPSNNYEIKINLEQEFFTNAYWKANSSVLFLKAQKWFPYIEPILKREGVPEDFKYVAIIESHLSNIVSAAGAAGFWQLVPASAQNYGLEVNEYVDERYHVEKSTKAACQHFKDAFALFKNWTLSAAAYNFGIGGIQGALKEQNANSYYDLLLNKETGVLYTEFWLINFI